MKYPVKPITKEYTLKEEMLENNHQHPSSRNLWTKKSHTNHFILDGWYGDFFFLSQ